MVDVRMMFFSSLLVRKLTACGGPSNRIGRVVLHVSSTFIAFCQVLGNSGNIRICRWPTMVYGRQPIPAFSSPSRSHAFSYSSSDEQFGLYSLSLSDTRLL